MINKISKLRISRRSALRTIVGGAVLALPGCLAISGSPQRTRIVGPRWWKLQTKIHGKIVPRNADVYESERQSLIWNACKPDRYPDAILHARDESDICEAVRFARSFGMKVAVRGRGHSWCGSSVRNGGLLIDLSQLNEITIDKDKQLAIVGPAVGGDELIKKIAPEGLVFPVGHCPSVPLSGYVLNGGLGWNSGVLGPACASLAALDLVNAEGNLIHADEKENSEYLWAARGAGPGFFGVATRYYLKLHTMPRAICGSTLIYPIDDAALVSAWLPALAQSFPREVELACFVVSAPPGAPPGKVLVVAATAFANSEADATHWLAPMADGPKTPGRQFIPCAPTNFQGLYEEAGQSFPQGGRFAADAFWLNASPRNVLMTLKDSMIAAPSPKSLLLMGIASGQTPSAMPDMAFSMKGSVFAGIYGVWDDSGRDPENKAWVRNTAKVLEPIKVGHYIGETDLTANANRAEQSFSPANWKRLQQLKKEHDPHNLFFSFLEPA